jgi:hypothetical protein
MSNFHIPNISTTNLEIQNDADLNQLKIYSGSGTLGLRSHISFKGTFGSSTGTGDTTNRRTADIISGFIPTGTWNGEYLAFNVGDSNDSSILTTERMRIDGSGNVGIGTTDPDDYKLDVSGVIRCLDNMVFGNTNNEMFVIHTRFGSGGDRMMFCPDNGSGSWDWNTNLSFTRTGKFGVMNQTPEYELDVAGDINFTGSLYQNGSIYGSGGGGGSSVWTEANSEAYYMGNVGIGIADPTEHLEIYKTGGNAQMALTRGDGTQIKLKAQDNQGRLTYEGGDFRFDRDESGTNTMILDSSGNVGIGNTSPTNKLDIVQDNARTGTHRTGAGLYVTSSSLGTSIGGIEHRHYNGTQGIGIGYNGIYASGTNTNQEIYMKPKGTGLLNVLSDISFGVNSKLKLDESSWQSCGNIELTSGSGTFGFHGSGSNTLGINVDGNVTATSMTCNGTLIASNYIQGKQCYCEIELDGCTNSSSSDIYENKSQTANKTWQYVYLKHTRTDESIPKVGMEYDYNRSFTYNYGFDDSNTNNSTSGNSPSTMYQIKVNVSGIYQFNYSLKMYCNSSDSSDTECYIIVQKNATSTWYGYNRLMIPDNKNYYVTGSGMVRMSANDYLCVRVYLKTSATINYSYDDGIFSCCMIGKV